MSSPAVSAPSFAHPALRTWFAEAFVGPTRAQELAWSPIADGQSTLLLAPTGSGKTLAAFLVALNRLVFDTDAYSDSYSTRVLYVSPLKALGVDVEHNLRAPLAGICAVARRQECSFRIPSVGVRTGDTTPAERARLIKRPPDILITTPESLFLMLTSRARSTLANVETVIVDEIHALVSGKRGVHLALSLERLEQLRRPEAPPLQRIGLSATQRSLEEIARFLAGAIRATDASYLPRPVTVVDAGRTKTVDVRVEVPVEDMVGGLRGAAFASGTQRAVANEAKSEASDKTARSVPSIWSAIHPRLVELVRAHRSTLLFVNSRRLAERLSAAINEEAGEELSLAHHGSISKERRAMIENLLKRGELPALVATSSLELGIDMGAVDLVVQVEAPVTVSSAIQRIGRSGHGVGQVPKAVIFPKHRGDLLPCATVVEHVRQGLVESSRYPRNPLDVLAQHIVSMLAMEPWTADALFDFVRQAAPFTQLPRASFDGILDMLSGRYPSERFRELRARINWDRISGKLEARRGAQLLVVSNGSVIVDRGLYGVFLAGSEPPVRVGELDEEMVFECRVGEVFVLGVSSWRIEDITHDRVLVSPAPGEPGRMPFWHGDKPGRPLELGRAVGSLARALAAMKAKPALARLIDKHGLERNAASNLLAYIEEQREAGYVPTDQRIVVESFLDEVGDWRVVVLSPFGGAVHAPWSVIVGERLRQELGMEVDSLWADDGMVFRLPELEQAPEVEWFIPSSQDAEERLTRALGGTALFAAHFRENAARSLLLPRRRPGQRMPLWVQRRRSADLLSLASEFPEFPIVLETYRECMQDKFDLRGLRTLLQAIEKGELEVARVTASSASPFASTLLFSYVAQFIYGNDAPLAERRAQALTLDQEQLRQLLGDVEMRGLFDGDAIGELENELQRISGTWEPRDKDDLLDVLRELGDLSEVDLGERFGQAPWKVWLTQLHASHAILELRIFSGLRWIAAEDAAKYRDGLGVALPRGVAQDYLRPQAEPLLELVLRFARTHGPFDVDRVRTRYQLSLREASEIVERLEQSDILVRGAFLPEGNGTEFCHADVLRRLKRKSVAKLRQQVEPLEQRSYSRFVLQWHGVTTKQRGLDALLNVIERTQGCALAYGVWVNSVFPSRIDDFSETDLDELCAAGEVVWRGRGGAAQGATGAAGKIGGVREPRVEFFLTDSLPLLADEPERVVGAVADRLRSSLRGTSLFFPEIVARVGGFPGEVYDTLWAMVWAGEVSNDTLRPVRSLLGRSARNRRSAGSSASGVHHSARPFRSRRGQQQGAGLRTGTEGRFSLVRGAWLKAEDPTVQTCSATERATARVRQLVRQWGVVTREAVAAGKRAGGFSGTYPVLKALDDTGELQRGYWVEGLGATQFVAPGVVSQLRTHRHPPKEPQWAILAASDPANVYGASVAWPTVAACDSRNVMRPTRAVGNYVVLERGELVALFSTGLRTLRLFISGTTREAQKRTQGLAQVLMQYFDDSGERACIIEQIDGEVPTRGVDSSKHDSRSGPTPFGGGDTLELAPGSPAVSAMLVFALLDAGFELSPAGLTRRRHSALLARTKGGLGSRTGQG